MGNMQQIMQQAQEMQTRMLELQEKLGDIEITADAGGGMVSVTINGKGEMTALKVDDSVKDDNEMMCDLIVAAFNKAKSKADETIQNETQKIMGEMGLPAGGMPF